MLRENSLPLVGSCYEVGDEPFCLLPVALRCRPSRPWVVAGWFCDWWEETELGESSASVPSPALARLAHPRFYPRPRRQAFGIDARAGFLLLSDSADTRACCPYATPAPVFSPGYHHIVSCIQCMVIVAVWPRSCQQASKRCCPRLAFHSELKDREALWLCMSLARCCRILDLPRWE